ncbi:hypothetical protein PGT21_002608 [Puccinia graminis f. sp. tritici]|uniref:Secreted protein n=1 Tax=Puccinia graminis f. sp. tritici TaxID=56615 RepID=A0A5B0PJ25_PUCGR|nr:hypothetical protein PGT21_002608 [Puccinia graminis f. sp. tritici]
MHVIISICILLTLKFALVSACSGPVYIRHACSYYDPDSLQYVLYATKSSCLRDQTSKCCDKDKLGEGEIKKGNDAQNVGCTSG